MKCTSCDMCRVNAVLIISTLAIQFGDGFELLLIFNSILSFPSIQTLTNSLGMVVNLKDVAGKLVNVSNQGLHFIQQNPKLICMILPRTIEGLIEVMLQRF